MKIHACRILLISSHICFILLSYVPLTYVGWSSYCFFTWVHVGTVHAILAEPPAVEKKVVPTAKVVPLGKDTGPKDAPLRSLFPDELPPPAPVRQPILTPSSHSSQ